MTWEQKKQQSLAILDRYKNDISAKEYQGVKEVIGSNAIEDIFATEEGIKNMIDVATGKRSADDIVAEYKTKWGVS